jgi:hypothetical protein
MTTFSYRQLRHMTPRPGVKYATVYIQQDPEEYQRLLRWLVSVAESIVGIAEIDPACAAWFTTPMPDYRRSRRGEYYSPQDIVTDMIDQMAHGRDLTEAMLGRWNRLSRGTPWEIDLVPDSPVVVEAAPQDCAVRATRRRDIEIYAPGS